MMQSSDVMMLMAALAHQLCSVVGRHEASETADACMPCLDTALEESGGSRRVNGCWSSHRPEKSSRGPWHTYVANLS